MPRVLRVILLVGALAALGSGAASAEGRLTAQSSDLTTCLRANGYPVTPESTKAIGEAPKRLELVSALKVDRSQPKPLTVTISRTSEAANLSARWLRSNNTTLSGDGYGASLFPVARTGRVAISWAYKPTPSDERAVLDCITSSKTA